MTTPNTVSSSDQLEQLIRRLRPKAEAILRRYEVSPEEAGDLLERLFLLLFWKQESIPDPERWILRNLERRCQSRTVSLPHRQDEPPPIPGLLHHLAKAEPVTVEQMERAIRDRRGHPST